MRMIHISRQGVTLSFALLALAALLLPPNSAPAAEILGLYTFEGASPAAFNDVSGQGLNPTTIGTGALDGVGYEGQAASFSGTQTPIEVPIDISPAVNATLTIGAWVKPDVVGQRGVFGHDNGGWDRGLTAGGNSGVVNWRPVGGVEHNSGLPVSVGAWQFVAVAYNGTTSAKFYADTNSVLIEPHSAGSGRGSLGIGALNHLTTWKFDGLIDNFFIFDDVLSDAEVETIRVNGLLGIHEVFSFGLPDANVAEGLPAGTTVGSLSTAASGTFTYALVAGAGDTGNASFQIGGAGTDVLQTAAILDRDVQSSYSVRIRSTETGGGGTIEHAITISVSANPFSAGATPIGFYSFEGDATDSSGNGNDGVVTGAVSFVAGDEGQALDTDSTVIGANHIDIPLNISPGVAPRLTMGAWVDADTITGRDAILSTEAGGWDRTLTVNGANYSLFTGQGQFLAGTASAASGYVFLCATWDGIEGRAQLFVDDTGYHVSSFSNPNNATIRVGSFPSNGDPFDGKIDSVFVYNSVLTFEEIEAIRAGGPALARAAGVGPGKMWSLNFNDDSGPAPNPGLGIGAGDVWNEMVVPRPPGPPATVNPSINLQDSTGAASTVTFSINGSVGAWGLGTDPSQPIANDYLFWNISRTGFNPSIGWELTGLIPGDRYEFAAFGATAAGREFNLRADSDADGDLSDESSTSVNQLVDGRGVAVEATADGTGKIIGDATSPDADEVNWAGLQIRHLGTPTPPPTPPTIAFDFGPASASNVGTVLSPPKLESTVDFDSDGNGDWWNRLGAVTGATDLTRVYDIQGNELEGVTIQVDDYINSNPTDGATIGWGTHLEVPTTAMHSIWHHNGSGDITFNITVKGLAPSTEYAVEVLVARNSAQANDISVNGLFVNGAGTASPGEGDGWDWQANGWLPRRCPLFLGTSTGSGEILVTVGASGGNSLVQGLRISTPAESTGIGNLWSADISATSSGSDTTMSGVEPFYGYGNIWNNIMLPHHTTVATTDIVTVLRDSVGAPTRATFRMFNPLSNVSGINGAHVASPLHSDFLILEAAGYPSTFDFEITGLSPGQPYEFYMYPGALAGRDLNLTLDANADGSLAGETTVFIAAQATGVGQLFTIHTDSNGRLFGQFGAPNPVGETNPAGFQLRELRKATVLRFR